MRNPVKRKIFVILIVIVVVVLIAAVFYIDNRGIYIGNYKVILTKEYRPIGKGVNNFKEISRYTNLDELMTNNTINTSFIEKLKQYTFKQASHISYYDLEQNKQMDSWEFKFENNNSQSLVITTNPPINNPVCLKENPKPEQIKIGNDNLMLTQNGSHTSMFLTSDTINLPKNNTIVWIDMNNISKADALAISKVLKSGG